MRSPREEAIAWFTKADKDLRLAELSLAEGPGFSDMVCYHAEQCAEKYLKGFLVAQGTEFLFDHVVSRLATLCSEIDPDFATVSEAATVLQEYATSVRYPPDEFGDPSPDAAEAAFRYANQIRDLTRRKLGL